MSPAPLLVKICSSLLGSPSLLTARLLWSLWLCRLPRIIEQPKLGGLVPCLRNRGE